MARGRTAGTRKGPGSDRSPSQPSIRRRLLELARNAAERTIQLGAEAVDHSDDRNGDTSGDQAVLDGRGARLVLQETRNEGLHSRLLRSHNWLSERDPMPVRRTIWIVPKR